MLHANAGTPRSSVEDSEDDCLQAWQLVSETCGRLVPPGLSLTPSPSGLGWPGVGGVGNRVLRLYLFAPRACLRGRSPSFTPGPTLSETSTPSLPTPSVPTPAASSPGDREGPALLQQSGSRAPPTCGALCPRDCLGRRGAALRMGMPRGLARENPQLL